MNETIKCIKGHKSIRKYENKPIDFETLKTLVEAGQWASTSSYVQAYAVIRVTDSEKRSALAHLSGDQKNVLTAAEFLVFCADLERLKFACDKHDTVMEDGFVESLVMASVDASLMAQNVMIAAESIGLGGVYVGGIRNDPEQVSALLELPERVYPIFGICLGWPAQDPQPKPRLPLESVFFENRYEFPNGDAMEAYDQLVKKYYIRRTKGRIKHTWTEQMAGKMGNEVRPHMMTYLKSKKFAQR